MIDHTLLDVLRKIRPEEQRLLNGKAGIQHEIYMDADSDVIDARKLLDQGELIMVRPHTRFAHFPEHRHNYVEVVYMCSGSSVQIANGREIILREGELLFFGQGARQEILPTQRDDIAINFIILPEFFTKILEMMDKGDSPLRKFIVDSLREDNANYLYFKVADVLPVQNLVENMIWLLMNPKARYQHLLCQTSMALLFMHLLNHMDLMEARSSEETAIAHVLHYIENNYRGGTLTEVAERLHYDLPWLSREIKRKTGKNYKELLLEKRLLQAEYFLKHTNLRVEEVGYAVGYENLSFFHRVFREHYGMTPKQFRENQ